MKKILSTIMTVSLALALSACVENQGQNVYNAAEVGKQADIQFGKVVAVRHVKIQAPQSGAGTLAGAATGGVAGSEIGHGNGSAVAAIAGAVVGGLIGSATEKAIRDDVGVEYIIKKENGKTVSIVQNIAKDDVPIKVGQRVMIQTSGEYQKASGKRDVNQFQRVLAAEQ